MRWLTGRAQRDDHQKLTILTRDGCHLCQEMAALVRQVAGPGVDVEFIDIDDPGTDPRLRAEHHTRIPVLLVDGVEIAHWRIDPETLARKLGGRSGPSGKRSSGIRWR